MARGLTFERRDEFFLEAACEIGRRLARGAVWHGDRCTWLGDDIGDDGEVVHRSLAGDLYGGTSGIGWFLAALWAASGDEEVAVAARGGLRHALRRAGDTPGSGAYSGLAGIALAAVTAGSALGDEEIVAAGARLGTDVACTAVDEGDTGVDLIGGLAGSILVLLELAEALDEEALRDAAGALGERLLARAQRTETGWIWPPANASEPPLCGFGHGASGPAVALLDLEAALGDPRFREGAEGSLQYERNWFSRDRGNWPDLRELDRDRLDAGEEPAYLVYWCHGAAGIGLARLHAFECTRDPSLLAEAGVAIDTATATMLRIVAARDGRPTGVDLSLCHGVGSVAELQIAAAETLGDVEHLAHARRLVDLAVFGRDTSPDANGATGAAPHLPAVLPCGVPGGGETPGLMLGLAGIGAMFLRLHDPALLPSPLLVSGWARPVAASGAPAGLSERGDRRVAPHLHHTGVALQLDDHGGV